MEQRVFDTKTGHCHILEDRIVLIREGFSGDVTTVSAGNNLNKFLFLYAGMAVYMLYNAVVFYNEGQLVRAGMRLPFGLLLLFIIYKSLQNSGTPVVYRNSIKDVKFTSATKLTRSYFTIWFEDNKGKVKKRLIMLPGSLSNGEEATQKAVKIMKEEGLLK